MSQIEINNPLDGKRLCNALADLLVKKFEETTPECKTEITVFNHRSFFIVNGFTTSTKTINIADLFKNSSIAGLLGFPSRPNHLPIFKRHASFMLKWSP